MAVASVGDPVTLAFLVSLTGALGLLLWFLPPECRCDKCAFHTYHRQQEQRKRAIAKHREHHSAFGIPWDSRKCNLCRQGRDDERPDK